MRSLSFHIICGERQVITLIDLPYTVYSSATVLHFCDSYFDLLLIHITLYLSSVLVYSAVLTQCFKAFAFFFD